MTIRPGSSGRRTGGGPRRLFWAALLLLLAWCSTVNAQPVELTPTSSNSTEQTLQSILSDWKQLKLLLEKRRLNVGLAMKQVGELSQSLIVVQNELRLSLEHSAKSAQEIERLTLLLDQSIVAFDDLQTTFDEYVANSQTRVRNVRILGAAGVALGIIFAILF